MSVHVQSQALMYSKARLAARLVLLALAHHAGDDGVCWVYQDTLATESLLDARSVRRAISDLEGLGEVQTRKATRGRKRVNVYRVMFASREVNYEQLPFDVDAPFDDRTDCPVVERDERTNPTVTTGHPVRWSESSPLMVKSKSESTNSGAPREVDRVRVTEVEHALSATVLAEWNTQTGQSLRSADWLRKVIMRIREHPELGEAEHAHIIAAALADPWWKGPASPSVVYGNGAQFEKCLMQAAGRLGPREVSLDDRLRSAVDRLEMEGR